MSDLRQNFIRREVEVEKSGVRVILGLHYLTAGSEHVLPSVLAAVIEVSLRLMSSLPLFEA